MESNIRECCGRCNYGHKGEIKLVEVLSNDKSWGKFLYCENAIKADRNNGFIVKMIKEPQKYYKVVSVLTDRYYSCYVNVFNELKVEYKIGEWVKPNIEKTDLMVFNDLEQAVRFSRSMYGLKKIFECKVKNPKNNGLIININRGEYITYVIECINRFINLKKKKKAYLNQISYRPPFIKNTVFCSAVKLIKEVVV